MISGIVAENKARLGIDEPPNQPSRGDPVNARPGTCYPDPVPELAVPAVPGLRRNIVFVHPRQQAFHSPSQRTLEKIDCADLLKPPPQPAYPSMGPQSGTEGYHFPQLAREGLVIARARIYEELLHFLRRQIVKSLHLHHRGLPLVIANRRRQPFQLFLVGRRIGQHVAGTAQGQRPIALELPPHFDALARPGGRQAEYQQQPWSFLRGLSSYSHCINVTYIT